MSPWRARETARLDAAPTVPSTGTAAINAFCTISKPARAETIRIRSSSGSWFPNRQRPISLSTALCRPMSSSSASKSPPESKRAAAWMPPVRSKSVCEPCMRSGSSCNSSTGQSSERISGRRW